MANIRKTFNFRNGVQVDEDNLVVDSVGKVGIGTSVPTEFLDVRGTAKVVGLVTASRIYVGNLEVTGIGTIEQLHVGIVSVSSSGIITSTSGVVTYYGDGSKLSNLPTSQWLDVDIGLGFTSIYAQGYVGVNTTSPFYPFQVGGTDQTRTFADVGATGVGIDSTGNIYSTGIITATSYYGSGAPLTSLSASNISSGTLNNDRLPPNINVSGVVTASSFVGNITGNVTGDVTGNVSGIALTASSLISGISIDVGLITSRSSFSSSGTVGVLTVTNKLVTENNVGIKTINPTSDLHVFSPNNGSIKLQSDVNESFITFGNNIIRNQNNGEISFGNTIRTFSNERSVDIANYDSGSINYYLHEGTSSGINTGQFNWIYGKNDNLLMRLSYDGNLGIGNTNPEYRLHVGGSSTITNNLYVGNVLEVANQINCPGAANFGSISINQLSAPFFEGNVIADSGISTFNVLDASEIITPRIGIGTTSFLGFFAVYNDNDVDFFNIQGGGDTGNIGIFTSRNVQYVSVNFNALSATSVFQCVGIGTTLPKSAADFSDAGYLPTLGYGRNEKRYMLLPRVTTAQRNNFGVTGFVDGADKLQGAGAVIYNTTSQTFEGYNGSTWSVLAGASGITQVQDDTTPQLGGFLDINGYAVLGTGTIGIVGNIGCSGIVTCSTVQVGAAQTGTVTVGSGVTIQAGIVTAVNGFSSGTGGAVQISVVGSTLIFNVPGVGTTSLTLY